MYIMKTFVKKYKEDWLNSFQGHTSVKPMSSWLMPVKHGCSRHRVGCLQNAPSAHVPRKKALGPCTLYRGSGQGPESRTAVTGLQAGSLTPAWQEPAKCHTLTRQNKLQTPCLLFFSGKKDKFCFKAETIKYQVVLKNKNGELLLYKISKCYNNN